MHDVAAGGTAVLLVLRERGAGLRDEKQFDRLGLGCRPFSAFIIGGSAVSDVFSELDRS